MNVKLNWLKELVDLEGLSKEDIVNTNNELVEVLTSLGYKNNDIKKILPSIDSTKEIEEQIKDALKLMLK